MGIFFKKNGKWKLKDGCFGIFRDIHLQREVASKHKGSLMKFKSLLRQRAGQRKKFQHRERRSKNNPRTGEQAFCLVHVTVQETLNMPVAVRTVQRSKARSRDQTETRVDVVPFPAWPVLDILAAPGYQNVAPEGGRTRKER